MKKRLYRLAGYHAGRKEAVSPGRVYEPHHIRGLGLEAPVTFWQRDPGLLAAGPEVHGRTQPGGVVQGAAAHVADCRPGRRRSADPRATLRADPARGRASTVGSPSDCPRLALDQTAGPLGADN